MFMKALVLLVCVSIACSGLYEPVKTMRLILLGKTGNGKSATGNSLLGGAHFDEGLSFSSNTTKCPHGTARRFGVTLEVIDTPGFKDTHLDDDVISREILRCVKLALPGPDAVLIAIRIGPFNEEEADTVRLVRGLFGEEIMQHVVVVFTHGDNLPAGLDVREVFARSRSTELLQLLEDIDHRYVVFNNKEPDPQKRELQVRRLMNTVHDLLVSRDNQDEKGGGSLQRVLQESLNRTSEAEEQVKEGTETQSSEQAEKNQLEQRLRAAEVDRAQANRLILQLTTSLKETEELNQQLTAKLEEEKIKLEKAPLCRHANTTLTGLGLVQ